MRRSYEVVTTPAEIFVAPKTPDEAVKRRGALQAEIEAIQGELGGRSRRNTAGRHVSEEEYNTWRVKRLHVLHAKQQEQRQLKAWLVQQRGGAKPSEWALLARTHQLLGDLAVPAEKQDETEALLEDIEFVVPGAFLQKELEKALARTG